jgi:hypothetical protein
MILFYSTWANSCLPRFIHKYTQTHTCACTHCSYLRYQFDSEHFYVIPTFHPFSSPSFIQSVPPSFPCITGVYWMLLSIGVYTGAMQIKNKDHCYQRVQNSLGRLTSNYNAVEHI